jgi:hypothetical protein
MMEEEEMSEWMERKRKNNKGKLKETKIKTSRSKE